MKTEFKGTKGKWRLVTNDGSHLFGGLDNYNKIVAGCGYYDINEPNLGFSISGYISKENSLLISKAPEMLEMLKLLIYRLDENDLSDLSATKRAKQLIKEATEL